MDNPFTRYPNPQTPCEHQANANYYTYERMGAEEELARFDALKIRAPQNVITEAHTMRWVEKEHARLARKAWQEASSNG